MAEDEKEKEMTQEELNKKSVVTQLRDLLKPSNKKKNVVEATKAKPYLKVIEGKDGISTIIYRCRNISAAAIIDSLEIVVSVNGTVETSEEQNLIVINDKTSKVEELKNTLLALDVRAPQILVEAKIVEVFLSDGMDRNFSATFNRYDADQNLTSTTGLAMASPGQTAATAGQGGTMNWYPYISGVLGENNKNFNLAVQWLLTATDAQILSSPNLVVGLGTTASIVTGEDIPIQNSTIVSGSVSTSTTYKRTGVTLSVTPKLINEDTVSLQVNPQVSNVKRQETIIQGDVESTVPVLAVRNIDTELALKDGQIIILGGLYLNNETESSERVPFLSDLPFIGELFTGKNVTKSRTQLLFFLKVNILSSDEIADGIIYDPGKQAEDLRKIGDAVKKSKNIFPDRGKTTLENLKEEMIDKDY
jgi:general secretion pathway protein D